MVYLFKLQISLFSTFVLFITNSVSESQKPYSKKELLTIDEFRPMVSKFLTMDYHQTDAYLLRWIRYNNFDLRAATKHLEKEILRHSLLGTPYYPELSIILKIFDDYETIEFHKFRASNEIDSILDANSDSDRTGTENPGVTPNTHKYLPYQIHGHDKEGRPILYVPFGRWSFRKYIIAGKPEIPKQHCDKIFERSARKAFREAAASGKDIDQFYTIGDLNGYSLRENGCLACLRVLANIARMVVAYTPLWKNMTLVNTPRIFNPALSIIKSIFGDGLPLSTYDFDKAAWQKKLLEEISLDQLPKTLQ